jgi:hypothetical protein
MHRRDGTLAEMATTDEADRATPPVAGTVDDGSRWWQTRRGQSLLAFALYAVASIMLLGLPILPRMSTWFLGWGQDPASHAWFLAWWPHAIGAGHDPFVSKVVWAPVGYNLAGSTGIPGPSLLLWPVTALFGPVVSYNLLSLAAPVLSAWAAFVLCRRVTGAWWPSLVGGYLYGFSPYEFGQLSGHPNLALVAVAPLAVALVVARVQGDVAARRFVVLLASLLVFQFLVSTEVSFSMALFGWVVLLAALVLFPAGVRGRLLPTVGLVAIAYVVAGIVLSPYLLNVVRSASHSPIYSFYPSFYVNDGLNFVVPTPITAVGSKTFASVSTKFAGNVSEQVGYVGLPVLAALVAFGVAQWRRAATRVVLLVVVIAAVCSLGTHLRIEGHSTIPLVWQPMTHVPLAKLALPGRFMLHAWLAIGVAVAMWLAGSASTAMQRARWGMAALAVVALLPNLSMPMWGSPVSNPPFFADGLYRQYLRPGENVLVIPYGDRGSSMYWQAETGFAFRMPGGYVSVVPPPGFKDLSILRTFYDSELYSTADRDLRAFLADKGVGAIVVVDGYPGPWQELFEPIDPSPRHAGGVTVYDVP